MARSRAVVTEDGFELPDLDEVDGSDLGYVDRLFLGYRDGKIFDYGDWVARDLAEMMRKPGKHRQIEAVLTYPTTAAERSFVSTDNAGRESSSPSDSGTSEIVDWVTNFFALDEFGGGCRHPLDLVIDQMTSAVTYRKSFHEIEWAVGAQGDYAAQIIPRGLWWRPQTTTRLLRDPDRNNTPYAIEQDRYNFFTGLRNTARKRYDDPNSPFIRVAMNRVLLHIHGARRDPINGLSDLEVPFWAHKTAQKILFLWMQFAEGVAQPQTVVKANDIDTAREVAQQIAESNGQGVVPVGTDGRPDSVNVNVLDRSGKGGDEFSKIIAWLGQESVNAVLAGFLNLTNNEKSGGGWALSADASDFFLMTLESKNREIERDLRSGLLAPMVRYNFGPKATIPRLKFEPLTAQDKDTAVELLNTVVGAYASQPELIPDELTKELVNRVSDYVGLDAEKLRNAFDGASKRAEAIATRNNPGIGNEGTGVARVAGAASAATAAVKAAQQGKDPVRAANGNRPSPRPSR